jgi:hypothetical protein
LQRRQLKRLHSPPLRPVFRGLSAGTVDEISIHRTGGRAWSALSARRDQARFFCFSLRVFSADTPKNMFALAAIVVSVTVLAVSFQVPAA